MANGVSERKLRRKQSILNRSSEDTLEFRLCWRLFWSVTTVCQGSSSVQWNWQVPVRSKDLLIHGRAKNRNIIITGLAICAKSFKPKPLKHIFSDRIFENSANDKCPLIRSGKTKSLFPLVQRLDTLAWYTAFAWRWNYKTTCPKEHLQWIYCDLNWCGYICNKQEFNHAQMPLQRNWWQVDRDDGWHMDSPPVFFTRAKDFVSLPKMFCKINIFD